MPRALRDQERARAARAAVQNFLASERDQKVHEEYRQELQQLPARIQSSGLGQTLAFYASKGANSMHGHIGGTLALTLASPADSTLALLDAVVAGDVHKYRRLTREALAFAEWLKRYAKAMIP